MSGKKGIAMFKRPFNTFESTDKYLNDNSAIRYPNKLTAQEPQTSNTMQTANSYFHVIHSESSKAYRPLSNFLLQTTKQQQNIIPSKNKYLNDKFEKKNQERNGAVTERYNRNIDNNFNEESRMRENLIYQSKNWREGKNIFNLHQFKNKSYECKNSFDKESQLYQKDNRNQNSVIKSVVKDEKNNFETNYEYAKQIQQYTPINTGKYTQQKNSYLNEIKRNSRDLKNSIMTEFKETNLQKVKNDIVSESKTINTNYKKFAKNQEIILPTHLLKAQELQINMLKDALSTLKSKFQAQESLKKTLKKKFEQKNIVQLKTEKAQTVSFGVQTQYKKVAIIDSQTQIKIFQQIYTQTKTNKFTLISNQCYHLKENMKYFNEIECQTEKLIPNSITNQTQTNKQEILKIHQTIQTQLNQFEQFFSIQNFNSSVKNESKNQFSQTKQQIEQFQHKAIFIKNSIDQKVPIKSYQTFQVSHQQTQFQEHFFKTTIQQSTQSQADNQSLTITLSNQCTQSDQAYPPHCQSSPQQKYNYQQSAKVDNTCSEQKQTQCDPVHCPISQEQAQFLQEAVVFLESSLHSQRKYTDDLAREHVRYVQERAAANVAISQERESVLLVIRQLKQSHVALEERIRQVHRVAEKPLQRIKLQNQCNYLRRKNQELISQIIQNGVSQHNCSPIKESGDTVVVGDYVKVKEIMQGKENKNQEMKKEIKELEKKLEEEKKKCQELEEEVRKQVKNSEFNNTKNKINQQNLTNNIADKIRQLQREKNIHDKSLKNIQIVLKKKIREINEKDKFIMSCLLQKGVKNNQQILQRINQFLKVT